MISRILLAVLLFCSFSSIFAACSWDENSVWNSLSNCVPTGSVTIAGGDYSVASGVKWKIVKITNQIILAGSLLSVGGIVFSAILYTTAMGADDKIKKAKESLKFAVIGFVVMLASFPLVNAIVNLIYWIG